MFRLVLSDLSVLSRQWGTRSISRVSQMRHPQGNKTPNLQMKISPEKYIQAVVSSEVLTRTTEIEKRLTDHITAQVGGLRAEIAGVKTEISGIKADIANVKIDIANVRTEMYQTSFNNMVVTLAAVGAGVAILGYLQTRVPTETSKQVLSAHINNDSYAPPPSPAALRKMNDPRLPPNPRPNYRWFGN